MNSRHIRRLLSASLLLAFSGCIIQPQPYTYRTYPAGVYGPPPPPPGALPASPTATAPTTGSSGAPSETPPGMPPQPSQEQPEVLTRGPVHEAFAQPVAVQTQPGLIVATQPPPNIIETPPADRPAGGSCIWAPGYWSWDAERNNYIWVSGCWRLSPPRMTWVPGYWTHVPTGCLWVPGFWSPVATEELTYLPAPPAVPDIQPSGSPPSADDFWVPGCWYWYQGRYVLRAGYWLRQQPGWVWTPSFCTWTPRGYIFVDGHWDYALEHRGVLFAPVCFPGHVSAGVRLAFSPSITVDVGVLSASLFACPRYEHYYFGDYYDDAYVQIGIYPWFDCVRIGTWYDPLFVYARWDHGRSDPRWEEHEHHEFALRHDDRDRRPPRTYREQEARVAHLPDAERSSHQMARPLSTAVAAPTAVKFEHVDAIAHQKIVQQSQETHNFRDARSHWETSAPSAQTPAPQSPVVGTRPVNHIPPTTAQPDRVRLPKNYASDPAVTPHSSDHPDRGSPDKPSNDHLFNRQ